MSKKNIKIIYDKKSRVLSVEIGKGRSVDSDIQDNVVLDYGKDGKITRISLYDFSFDQFRSQRSSLKQFTRSSASLPRR